MLFNQQSYRTAEERQKDLRREADQARLAKQTRREPRRQPKSNPLWMRVWVLFF